MKKTKFISILMVAMLITALTACGKTQTETKPETEKNTTENVADTSKETEEINGSKDEGFDVTYDGITETDNTSKDDLGDPGEMKAEDGDVEEEPEVEVEGPAKETDIEVEEGHEYLMLETEDASYMNITLPVDVAETRHSTINGADILTITWNEDNKSAEAYFRYTLNDGHNLDAKLERCLNNYSVNSENVTYRPAEDSNGDMVESALPNEEFTVVKKYQSLEGYGYIYLVKATHECDGSEPECSNGTRYYVVFWGITDTKGNTLKFCFDDEAGYLCESEDKIITNTEALFDMYE